MDQLFANFQFWGGAAITAILLFFGHFFPWDQLLGRKLPRIPSYVYGVVSLHLGFSFYHLTTSGDWQTVVIVWLFALIGGLATAAAYGIDRLGSAIERDRRVNGKRKPGQNGDKQG